LRTGSFISSTICPEMAASGGKGKRKLEVSKFGPTMIAVEKNSTIVFPLPIDLIEPFADLMKRMSNGHDGASAPEPATPPAIEPATPSAIEPVQPAAPAPAPLTAPQAPMQTPQTPAQAPQNPPPPYAPQWPPLPPTGERQP